MKLKDFNTKKARVLHDIVAFKWIKTDKLHIKSLICLPDSIVEKGGQGRMGNRYTCVALSIGPNVTQIKPGDWFLIHEYDKLDQETIWDENDIMFCEEGVIPCILPEGMNLMIPAKMITDEMMDEYEDY